MNYFLCIDIGTSSAKLAIVSLEEHIDVLVATNQPYPTYYPHPGWCEQNPEDWWEAVKKGILFCFMESGIKPEQIKAVGVAGQSWSNIAVDQSGKLLYQCPIWTDTRSKTICKQYLDIVDPKKIFAVSGNPFMPGYQLPKILWLMEHEPEVYQNAWQFMSSNGYINYKLTGKSSLDHSQIYGLHNISMELAQYDENLSDAFKLDLDKLPPIFKSTDIIGEVTKEASFETKLKIGTPVIAGGLDAAVSTLGVGVYRSGMVQEQGGQAGGMSIALDKMIAHESLIMSRHVVEDLFLLQGGTVGGGASFEWISNLFKSKHINSKVQKSKYFMKLDELAGQVPAGSEGLIFLPYMAGERSPIWDSNAQGVFFGLNFNKSEGHLIRSVMEGVAFSLRHNLDLAKEMSIEVKEYRATGGSANSKLWTQIKADITSCRALVPDSDEATVKGIALLCGLALGEIKNLPAYIEKIKIKRVHEPNQKDQDVYDFNYKIYRQLYMQLKEIMAESNEFYAQY